MSAAPWWIVLALLWLLRGALALVPTMWGWGLNVQRFLGPAWGFGTWLLGTLLLVPPIARIAALGLAKVGDFIADSRRAQPAAWMLGAALVWLMPDRVWFVGDFMIRLGNVESGSFAGNYISALPLDYVLHSALLHLFGQGSAAAANLALRGLGAIEAGFLAVLAVVFARALGRRGALAALACGVACGGGYLTMFTGLGKPAGEMCLATLALAAFGIGAIRRGSSLLPCSLALALALGLHRSSVMLLPAWVAIVALWWRAWRASAGRRPSAGVAIALPIAAAIFALPRIATIAFDYDLSHHVLNPATLQGGSLVAAVLAPRHLLDLANLLCALSPLALALPVVLPLQSGALRKPGGAVLTVLALSFVPALLLIDPQQGVFRDWDVFAPAGLAGALLAADLALEAIAAAPARCWLVASLLGVTLLSSLQWLALNRSEVRGLDRVRAYLLEPPGPEAHDRPLVWDFLATRNMRLQRWSAAEDAAAHAAIDAPHPRVLLMWAYSATMAGDDPIAERVYRRLLEREPGYPLAWLGLAGIARRLKEQATLDSALDTLRSYPPEGRQLRTIRRHLSFFPQTWPAPDSIEGWSPRGGATAPPARPATPTQR